MRPSLSVLAVLAVMTLVAPAQDEPKPPPQDFEVKPEPFRAVIATEGFFVPVEAIPLRVDPQEWKALSLLDLKPHGTPLQAGGDLATFETDDLEEKIGDAERAQQVATVNLERETLLLASLRQTTPLDLDAARRLADETQQNYDLWTRIFRPLEEEEAKRALKNAEQALFFAQEELRQLEKMYKADDLTEDTEEVILKRARWAVERNEFTVKQTTESSKHSLEVRIPRMDIERKDAATRARIAREKAEKDCDAALKQKELTVAELQHAFGESAKKLGTLKADLALLKAVRAPKAGWLLWGDWTTPEGPARFAEFEKKNATAPRACIAAKDVFATLAAGGPPRRIAVRLAQGHRQAIGWRGPAAETLGEARRFATLDAAPRASLPVAITGVDAAPDSQGRFLVTLACDPEAFADDDLPPVTPGLRVRVTLVDYRKADALAVPPSFIDTEFDAQAGSRAFVYVKQEGGNPEKRAVRIGHRNDKRSEIVDGLRPGEKLVPVP